MLRKLRSRHPIDLPRGKWGRAKPILAVLGTLAILFVLIPLLLSPLLAARVSIPRAAILIGAGFGTLVFVLVLGGIRGKSGWQR
jgi:hypothetical protein